MSRRQILWLAAAGALVLGAAAAWFAGLAVTVVLFIGAWSGALPEALLVLIVPLALLAGVLVGGAYWMAVRKAVRDGAGGASPPRWLLALPLLALAALVVDVGSRALRDREAEGQIAGREEQARRLAEIKRTRFAPEAIAVTELGDGRYLGEAWLAGARPGEYALRWSVIDAHYGRVILSGEDRIALADPRAWQVTFERAAMIRGYQANVLNGNGARASIDEDFRLVIALSPALRESERDALPSHLRHGDNARELTARGEAPFRVRFSTVAE